MTTPVQETATKNSSLHSARRAKDDEFYTQLGDIENEMKHYREHFRDKTIFLNCDDPQTSEFWFLDRLRVGWWWVGLCWRQGGRWSGWWGRFGLFACTGALIVCGQPGYRVKGAPSGHELRPKTSRRALPEGRAYFVENLFGLRP